MASATIKPTGMGTCSVNYTMFSTGCGVTDSVSDQVIWPQIVELVRNPQNVPKAQARWILPNDSPARKRKNTEHSHFGVLWSDIDEPPSGGIDAVVAALNPRTPYLAYATKSATVELQKCRVLIPLLNQLDFSSWLYHQKRLNSALSNAGIHFDPCNLNPAQILFLPNRGEFYDYRHREGLYPAKSIPKADEVEKPTKNSPQSSKGRVIDQFNARYSVADILRLADYDQNPRNPLQWRHPYSQTGGFSTSIDPVTGRVHAMSSRDPLYTKGGGIGAHDAFSAFCVLVCDGSLRWAVWRAANEILAKEAVHD